MTNNRAKIKMFAVNNNTDKWLVAIDGYFQLFDDENAAKQLYDKYPCIDDSAFGSMMFLPPHTTISKSGDKISNYRQIILADYVAKREQKIDLAVTIGRKTGDYLTNSYLDLPLSTRLDMYKFNKSDPWGDDAIKRRFFTS